LKTESQKAGDQAPAPRVLVVDDKLSFAEMVRDDLEERGFEAKACSSGVEALTLLESSEIDAVVTDIRMPDMDGIELLDRARKLIPSRPVIVMTAFGAVDSAIESIRRGAYHYLTKPFKADELALFLRRALDDAQVRKESVALKRALRQRFAASNIVAESAGMRAVVDLVERVADAAVPVLITGETGTGKGLVAQAIHAESSRASHPFIAVNCAALPDALLESEMFGHVRGAFTGATSNRTGLIEEADGGTLLLDEIAEMPLSLQSKLLHVLERGAVRAVGANREKTVNVRLIAATNRDLESRVSEGAFREDLLYRLNVMAIEIPALRKRPEDLPALLARALARSKDRNPASPVLRFSQAALYRLGQHAWPGNVRELQHVVERLVLLGRDEEVSIDDLPSGIPARKESASGMFQGPVLPLRQVQRRYVRWAYEQIGGPKSAAAAALDVDIKTFNKWLAEEEHDSNA
jgi:two-component system, NtrC family, response regulator HydG